MLYWAGHLGWHRLEVKPGLRERKAGLGQMPTAVARGLEGWAERGKKNCGGSREQHDHHHYP